MSHRSRSPVVIDTGVFGARLTPTGRLLASRYRSLIEGRSAVLSFVTVAELQYGARFAGWDRTGSDALTTRSAWPRSCGPARIWSTHMRRCVLGASGQGMLWARRRGRSVGGRHRGVAAGSTRVA
jgi:hypothetical protein